MYGSAWNSGMTSTAGGLRLPRQRIRPQLEMQHLAGGALAGFSVERRARREGGPQPFAFPARVGIVDAAVHPFRVEPERIGNAQHDPLPVLVDQQPFRTVAGVDRG